MPDVTTGLAIWGAFTGTLAVALAAWALIWQMRTRHEAPHPNLRVELCLMADKPYLFTGGVGDYILIQVTNLGPLPVRVVAAGILPQTPNKPEFSFRPIAAPEAADLPHDVQPQKGMSILLEYQSVRRVIALSKPAVGWVRTDTGQRFDSPRTQVVHRGAADYEADLKPTLPGYG